MFRDVLTEGSSVARITPRRLLVGRPIRYRRIAPKAMLKYKARFPTMLGRMMGAHQDSLDQHDASRMD